MSFLAPLLAILAQVAPIAVAAHPSSIVMPPPSNWVGLPELHFLRRPAMTPDLSAFVRDEVTAGHCASVVRSPSGTMLTIDFVVLVGVGGHVKRIVPRAIDCVAIEQYAAGLVSRQARDNVDASGVTADSWLHTTMTFVWAA